MKKLLLLTILSLLGIYAFGQDQTLMSNSNRFGVYVSPIVEMGPFDQNADFSSGGAVGFIFSDITLGFYGMASIDLDGDFSDHNDIDRLDLAHGGLFLNYTFKQQNLLHPYGGIRAGWGATNIEFDDDDFDDIDEVFVLTPEFGIELNVAPFLRIAAFGTYRLVNGVNSQQPISDSDLSGFTGGIGVRLGWFGRDRSYRNWE